jgi:hypothetical protein
MVLLVWAGVVAFFIVQGVTTRLVSGRPMDWRYDVVNEFGYWVTWLIVAPLIIWAWRSIRFHRGQRLKATLLHIGVGVVVSALQVALGYVLYVRSRERGVVVFVFFMAVYRYWLIVALLSAWRSARLYADASTRLARAQLDRLKSQLQPHFLFNTLNSISVLVQDDPATAQRMIGQLSELLRIAVDTTDAQLVSLREELDFTTRYLAIQQLRFGDRLRVDLNVEQPAYAATVPHLLLQPLVENAVRHGLDSAHGGTVALKANLLNGTLVVAISDSGAGSTDQGAGVGLTNTRARLEFFYGREAELSFAHGENGSTVTVTIPQSPHG